MYASISHTHSLPRDIVSMLMLMPILQNQSTWLQVITWDCVCGCVWRPWWAWCGRARVRLARAARPERVKSPLVFLPPALLRSAVPLLGDSSCGFHSAALHPAHQHCSAAADDEDDDDDDDNIDEDDDNNSHDNQYREGAFHFIKRILFTSTCYNHCQNKKKS